MRNLPVFVIFSFVFFFVFACDLQFPKEIEISKQTPTLRFKADMDEIDLEDIFGDLESLDFGTDSKVRILNCENTDTLTWLICIDVFNDNEGKLGDAFDDIISKIGFGLPIIPVPVDTPLIKDEDDIELKSPTLPEILENFALESLEASLFIYGNNTPLLDALAVRFSIGDDTPKIVNKTKPSNIPSGVGEIYEGTALPAGGHEFKININDDMALSFEIYLKKSEEGFKRDWLEDGLDITVELAIWFPFEFRAKTDARIDLPFNDLFNDGGGDLFGRDSEDEDSFIEFIDNLQLEIVLNRNPFPGSTILLKSGSNLLNGVIVENTIRVDIDKNKINYPFSPSFSVLFKEDDKIYVPRILTVDEFTFKAKMRGVIDISDFTKGWSW